MEGQYEMPLPLKHSDINLPNNKVLARRRLDALRRRLEKDEKYRNHYFAFMDEMVNRGHAEKVPESSLGRDNFGIYPTMVSIILRSQRKSEWFFIVVRHS